MKKLTVITILFLAFMGLQNVSAQPIAALHQSGQTTFFSGIDAFVEAYNASADGAIIYLSGGSFLVPDTIAKSITVFGAGHHPEFTGATGQSKLTEDVLLAAGAGNAYFEGLYLTGRLSFVYGNRIDDVVFRRCRIDGIISYGSSVSRPDFPSNTLFTECVLTSTSSHLFGTSRNVTIANSILFANNLAHFHYGTLENSLILSTGSVVLTMSTHSVVRNCVIAKGSHSTSNNNAFLNNVFFNVESMPAPGTNTFSNNYYDVGRDNFFVDQEGAVFDYTHDYHLRLPAQYMGTDGTQVGIYGGMHPFKEGSVPMIPHVISKSISHSIDAEGKLQVEIEVSAQDH